MNKGKFIVFEGIDGSGKSTQIEKLTSHLKKSGVNYYTTFEPTDSPIGSLIHNIMIGRIKTDPKVIAGLFVADRLDHLLNELNGISRKIDEGITVVSDRYYFSSYAYHSVDMPMEWIVNANSLCAQILKPSMNVFIDVNPQIALKRIADDRPNPELFENILRLKAVREKYFEAFNLLEGHENICIIDGNREQHDIELDIWNSIKSLFI